MEKQLRIGVIGYGLRGNLAQVFHQPNGQSVITGFCELLNERMEKFKKDVTTDCFFTKNYKELLTRDDIDAILLLTEDHTHADMAVEILEAGKDLYLEKPMAISIEDCDRIIETWRKTNRKLMIGFNMRYMPMYETMKWYLDQGFIGDIKAIWVRHFVGRGGRYYYQDWHRNSKYTNSLLLQKASHDIDVIHMLANSYTKKVSALGKLDFYNDPKNFEDDGLKNQTDVDINVEDNNTMIMELENGVLATYMQCHFTPEYSRNYTIIGTKGRMENDDINQTITIKTRHTKALRDQSDLVIHMKPQLGHHDGGDERIVKAFVDYIFNDVEPNASVLDGRMSVAVGCQATKSLRNGGGILDIPKCDVY
ncbi:Gfo/Idh/MocA family oxidoreductase [Carnobacteriaceae bacterium zg-C25]|nr:Gfo/Idh/MocA family oxidoreductase [Carnobacteriaceae bacterium zg-C25]